MEQLNPEETVRLILLAQEGERGATDELFSRYIPRVRDVVQIRMGSRAREIMEDEDVVQEVMMLAHRDLQGFTDLKPGAFILWLSVIARNVILMQIRGQQAEKRGGGKVRRLSDMSTTLSSALFQGDGATPSRVAQDRELQERLDLAIENLSTREKEILVHRHVCELPYREIVDVMDGINEEASARSLYARTISRLSDMI